MDGHLGLDSILLLSLAVIAYFIRDIHKSNREKHTMHFEKFKELEAQIPSDAEILTVVNGKYLSRSEQALMMANSEQQHSRLSDAIAHNAKEIETLRKDWHDRTAGILQGVKDALDRTQ
jgi:hypothetical protein